MDILYLLTASLLNQVYSHENKGRWSQTEKLELVKQIFYISAIGDL